MKVVHLSPALVKREIPNLSSPVSKLEYQYTADLELGLWGSSDDNHSNFGVRCFRWSNLQSKEVVKEGPSGKTSPSPFCPVSSHHPPFHCPGEEEQ
jgi:hypothetical protein